MNARSPLDPARAREAAELFADALELAPEERGPLLHRACADDPALRAEVDSLLAAHAEAGEAFRTPPRIEADLSGPEPGRQLGPYRLVSLIASGGMGSVYEAERADQEFHKRVAIKLVRAGPGVSGLHERLRFERQVLAGLEHPNIARLLDGGSTADGTPFLVMEFVDGTPIDRFADARRLPVADRLRLFLEVCEAVQFAHRHLVVHRDLKPGNILVDVSGRVKLLDFGIAKVLEAAAGDPDPGVTALRAMTPRYASPEQIRHLPVTTSTDVYSLGVLLYELLCGAPPYRLEGLSTADSERLICEAVPREPSAVARTAAAAGQRGTTPARLARLLHGDLDTILLKALAKEPERRYPTVEEFAADLRRHLAGDAVLARPDSAGYRLGRFARRHRAGVAGAGGIVLLLVAFATAMGVQARRVAAERDRASAAAAEARAVSVFLQDVLRAADPGQPEGLGRSATVEQAVDHASRRLDEGALAGQPNVEAAVRRALGTSYFGLGMHDAAGRQFERALEIRRRLEAGGGPEVAEALSDLAALRHAQGRPAAADSMFREVLAMQSGAPITPRHELAHTINNLGVMRRELGAPAEAESLYRVARGLYEASSGADVQKVAGNLTNLAIVLVEQGRPAEAGPLLLEAVERYRSALGPDHPDVARALGGLGQLRRRQGDVAGADSAYQAMVEIRRRALGPEHPDYAVALNNLSAVRRDQARYPSAESLLREALGIWRRTLGERHPNVATGLSNLATLLVYQGRFGPADSLAGEALAIRREALGPEHPDVALSLYQLGVTRLDAGRPGSAEPALRQSLAIRESVLPARHVDTAESMAALGRCLLDQGRVSEAERLLRESVAIQAERQSTNWRRHEAISLLGSALVRGGHPAEGESLMASARDSLDASKTAPQLRRTQARERLERARRAVSPGGPSTAGSGG